MNRPANELYWAVLEAPGYTRNGVLPPGLLAAFEEEVPVPLAELHAVCTPVGDGRVLVCAALRAELSRVDREAAQLVPESIPGFSAGDAESLNLLVGAFEPPSLRKSRDRRHMVAATLTNLCAVLVAVGLARRTSYWHHEALANAAETQRLTIAAGSSSPESLATDLELARRRAGIRRPQDAAVALASILSSWPTRIPSKPQSISVGEQTASLSTAVEGDPSEFLSAIAAPKGWALDEPRLNTAGTLTRITFQLKRVQGAAP